MYFSVQLPYKFPICEATHDDVSRCAEKVMVVIVVVFMVVVLLLVVVVVVEGIVVGR